MKRSGKSGEKKASLGPRVVFSLLLARILRYTHLFPFFSLPTYPSTGLLLLFPQRILFFSLFPIFSRSFALAPKGKRTKKRKRKNKEKERRIRDMKLEPDPLVRITLEGIPWAKINEFLFFFALSFLLRLPSSACRGRIKGRKSESKKNFVIFIFAQGISLEYFLLFLSFNLFSSFFSFIFPFSSFS